MPPNQSEKLSTELFGLLIIIELLGHCLEMKSRHALSTTYYVATIKIHFVCILSLIHI